jgi:predicted nucleic acid-binding Zn ribbon protein
MSKSSPVIAMPQCAICSKATAPHRKYCPRCRKIMKKAHSEFVAHREALKAAWNKAADGFLCVYSGVKVDELDPTSPWHISFDHPVPKEPGKLCVTTELFNFMKKDLTSEEFPIAVLELDRVFNGGAFRKNVIPFRLWFRLPGPPVHPSEMKTAPFEAGNQVCEICGSPAPKKGKYCSRCNRFILHHSDKAARIKALKEAWDPKRKGFACRYTKIILEELNFHDPWYITFDHPDPDDPTRLVVAAAWVNGMKTDLTDEEFRAVTGELARHIKTGATFNNGIAEFKCWRKKMMLRLGARRRIA